VYWSKIFTDRQPNEKALNRGLFNFEKDQGPTDIADKLELPAWTI